MEPKPIEQYEVVPNMAALTKPSTPDGNGNQPVPDGRATIDEQSRQTAMARAMIENEKRQREQRCGAEIDKAIQEILKRHRCAAKFCELREGGQTTRIWLQPVAQDEPTT